MPGNEHGDRVHNFFAQDNPSHGQHESHVVEGNWPVQNNNFWVGSQRQIDVLNSSSKNISPQSLEIDRGQPSYPVHAAHGLNFSQSNLRPDFSRNQSLYEQQYSNGFMYGNQLYQTRQNEANFLAVDTDSDQRHVIASSGLLGHELRQGSGHEQQPKATDRSVSAPPVSLDLFGGQQQMSHQQESMLQALQHQQSGFNDMQQLQKQLMVRKMQDHQRQSLQHLDLRNQNLINQVPPLTWLASGSHSSVVNGSSNSDALRYPWTAEPSTYWLARGSSAMQGSPSGITVPPNPGQTQHLMDLIPQQVDQSLYGVPVSNSKGLTVNRYPQIVTERSSMPHTATSSNSLHGNQHNFLLDRSSGQEGTSTSRQKFQNENSEYASSQSLNTGMKDMGFLRQVNSLQKDTTQQDFARRQELATQSETSHERSRMQVSSPQDEVTLDPTEEKILYGSDDNLWAAFGKSSNISGESGDIFDIGGLSNGIPSIQSGSWSALMQSAVAETSTNDIAPQEEWSGLIFNSTDGSSANQLPSVNNNGNHAPFSSDIVRIPSASCSGPVPPSNVNTLNPMGSNQHGHSFPKEFSERVPTDMSQGFGRAFEEATQMHLNAPQHAVNEERNPKTASATWAPSHSGNRSQPNGWSALSAVSHGGDRVLNIHEAEKESHNSQNNQVRVVQGELLHGSSLWKSSSVSSSANELGPVRSVTGNLQSNKGTLSFHDTSSVANSFTMGGGDGTYPFVQSNSLLNQWRNASPSAKFQGGEDLGRMMDQVNEQNQGSLNNYDKEVTRYNRENSNDSHQSNLSRRASGGFRESGLSDAIDSRPLPSGKQKSTNQLASKASVPRKFQYHPMGNLDEEVEPTQGLQQPTQGKAISLQNAQFGQSKLFGQFSRYSTEKGELPNDHKSSEKEPSAGSFPGYTSFTHIPSSRPFDSYTNKASSPSQNMLELLHKVDQSRDHGSVVHFNSSECNVSSQLPEAEKDDGSVQHSQCSSAQGFGLQLGPPSQLLQNPDLSSPSQDAQGTFNSMHSNHAGTKMGEKGMLTVPTSSVQSLPFPNEEPQTENRSDKSTGQGHMQSNLSLYKAPVNHYPAFTSDTPHRRNQLQNTQTARASGKLSTNQHIGSSFNSNTSHFMQRGSAESILPDAFGNLQKDNLASSVSMAQQAGRHGVQEMDPSVTASSRDQMRGSQPFGLPGISRQGASNEFMHNIWSNAPLSQHALTVQYQKASHLSELIQPNILESGAQGDLDDGVGDHISSKSNAIHANCPVGFDGEERRLKENSGQLASFVDVGSAPKTEVPLARTSSIMNPSDDSPPNSASTQDIEAFGRSLKPHTFSNEKFTLLNQTRALKDGEIDPSISFSKRIRVPDNICDARQANLPAKKQMEDKVGDTLGSNNEIPSEESRMLSFSAQSDDVRRKTAPHGNAVSEDIVAAGLHDSRSNPPSAARVNQHSVSPQMAPSWFNQYGTFKNLQTLPVQNAHMRLEESPVTVGKSSSVMDTPNLEDRSTAHVVACGVSTTHQNFAPKSEGNEHLSDELLQPNVAGQIQVISRPKKRKSATSELNPWCREVLDGSQNLLILSVAEADWSKAANRLTEKVEDDVELIEDGPPLLRSKRRLVMTTQLMQQLLSPPPASILSTDASSECECVAYAVSRVMLGDACSALSSSNNQHLPSGDMDLHAVKDKLNGDPRFAQVIENLLGKARKLENDFLRLDKNSSILDLRLECQDLEKFSVINRFAKFHGRGQGDNAEAPTTDATSTTHKPCAQRYVTAVPMPRSLPERVQCLSL